MTSLLLWEQIQQGKPKTNDQNECNSSALIVLLSIFNNDVCMYFMLRTVQLINNGHTSADTVKLVDLIKMFD